MVMTQPWVGRDRRVRDRSEGIVLRRRQNRPVAAAQERRKARDDGFDIAGALELHLDQCTTRRAMLTLLDGWLKEATEAAERDDGYVGAVEHAIEVMKSAPDPLTAIAILQRRPEA